MKIENYLSELDTKRFGFKIAKVNDFEKSIEDVLHFLKENDVKLVLSKISIEDLDLINKLELLRFEIKDIQVTYKYKINGIEESNFPKNEKIIIRELEKEDIPILQKIASHSFLNYGHYAKDNKLDKNKCSEIYADWILRSCEDSQVADKVFVADYLGEVAGFLSFKIFHEMGVKYAAGGIGAVSENYRNMNVFGALTHEGIIWGSRMKLDWEEHNVLIDNYPVNKSFVKSGFFIYKSFVTMHHWIS